MAENDVWGNSWGDSWGSSWAVAEPDVVVRFQIFDNDGGEDRIDRRDRTSSLRRNLRNAAHAVSEREKPAAQTEPTRPVTHTPSPEPIRPTAVVVRFADFVPLFVEPNYDEEIALLLMAA